MVYASNPVESEFKYVRFCINGVNNKKEPQPFDKIYMVASKRANLPFTDSYCGIFLFKNDIVDYYHKHNRKIKGFKGIHDARFIPIDIDEKNNLKKAQESAKFIIGRLESNYDVPPSQVRVYFSGSKGFHLLIPKWVVNYEPDKSLNRQIRNFVEKITEGFQIDPSIYDQVRLLRLPNSQHSDTGLYKIPLYLGEIFELNTNQILDLAKQKREIPEMEDEEHDYPLIKNVWEDSKPKRGRPRKFDSNDNNTEHKKRIRKSKSNIPSPRKWLCIENIMEGVGDGERNECGFRLAVHLKKKGIKLEECIKILKEWNNRNKPPKEPEEIEKITTSAYEGKYEYRCIKDSIDPDPVLEKYCDEECLKEDPDLKDEIYNLTHYLDEDGNPKMMPMNSDTISTLSEFIWKRLSKEGSFICHKDSPFLIYNGRTYPLDSSAMADFLFVEHLGLIPGQTESKGVLRYMKGMAVGRGRKVSSFGITYLDKINHTLYINTQDRDENNNDIILKIEAGNISKVENGQNDILLGQCNKSSEWTFDDSADTDSSFKMLIDLIWKNLACLTHERTFFLSFVLASFIKDYTNIHPIMKASGSKGSGKSAAHRLASFLLYGDDELSISTTASIYAEGSSLAIFLDNLERYGEDLRDLLLTSATGIKKIKRKLGTDSSNTNERVYSLIFLNSIVPLTLPELIQRTIDISFNKGFHRASFYLDGVQREIIRNRGYILSGIVKFISEEILPDFKAGKQKDLIRMMNETFPGHEKERINEFLILMYPFFEKISLLMDANPKIEWAKCMNMLTESDQSTQAETSHLILLLDQIKQEWLTKREVWEGKTKFWKEYGFEPTYPFISDTQSTLLDPQDYDFEMTLTINQLHIAFSRICKNIGIKYQYESAKELVARLRSENEVLSKQNWEIDKSTIVKGYQNWTFRRKTPFEYQETQKTDNKKVTF